MQVLTDLKKYVRPTTAAMQSVRGWGLAVETRSPARVETCEGPRATMKKRLSFTVGRGPVPRHASIGMGNGPGRRAVFARVEGSRGTGPRATGPERVLP